MRNLTVRLFFYLIMLVLLSVVLVSMAPPSVQAASWTDCSGTIGMNTGDCASLVDLYNNLNGSAWGNNWLTTNTPCSWSGVVCNGAGRVVGINLYGIGASGIVPASVGNLTSMTSLNLANNPLVLTTEIGTLTNLQVLYIGSTNTTTFPSWVSNLTGLRELSAAGSLDPSSYAYGGFSGYFPAELCSLSALMILNLANNSFTSSVPSCVTAMGGLAIAQFSNNPSLVSTDPAMCAYLGGLPSASWSNTQICPTCGDGIVAPDAGEQCDPPNGTTCNNTCQLIVVPPPQTEPPPVVVAPAAPPQTVFGDNRLNDGLDLVLYCAADGGVQGLNVINGNGEFAFQAARVQIDYGLQQASQNGQNVQIASGPLGAGLWALTTGELQATVRQPRQNYDFFFSPNLCGGVAHTTVAASAPATTTSSAFPPGHIPQITGIDYIVQPGDTLAALAARYGTTVEAIYAANNLVTTNLLVQQILIVPGATNISSWGQTSTSCTSPYTVQSGDTMFRIALNCGTTVEALAARNGIVDPSRISVGQQLLMP